MQRPRRRLQQGKKSKLNNFFTRTLTGAGLVLVMMGSILLHPVLFALLGLLLAAGIFLELRKITTRNSSESTAGLGIALLVPAYILAFLVAFNLVNRSVLNLLILIIPIIAVAELYTNKANTFSRLALTSTHLFIALLPYTLMMFASAGNDATGSILAHKLGYYNPWIIAGFFILLWVNDTGAYLAGSSLGRHKLFERISPKKTWEGFFGGLMLGVAAAIVLSKYLSFMDLADWIIISILVSVGGTFGDLFASMLKRESGIKDSGNILPGHGGFLDRFDGVIIAFPLVFLYITLFG